MMAVASARVRVSRSMARESQERGIDGEESGTGRSELSRVISVSSNGLEATPAAGDFLGLKEKKRENGEAYFSVRNIGTKRSGMSDIYYAWRSWASHRYEIGHK